MGIVTGSNIGPAIPVIIALIVIGAIVYVRRHRSGWSQRDPEIYRWVGARPR